MSRPMKRHLFRLGCALAVALCVGGAYADAAYPNRPVKLVVPFAPGGPTDVFGRLFAQRLSDVIGQPVVVENKGGAGGVIGAESVAKATPDGYTILFGTGSLATAAALAKLPFDPRKDLEPIAQVGIVPLVLLAAPNMPKTLPDFLKTVKDAPGKYSYGSAGPGTTTHLAAEMLKSKANLFAVHIPYRGSGPALQDTAAGVTAFLFETVTASKALVDSGKLNLIAVGTQKRSPLLPDVPSLSEANIAGMGAYTWNVIFAPAGTPSAVVERLNKASNKVLLDPAFKKRMADLATEIVSDSTPASAKKFYLSELDTWGAIVKAAGVQLQ